MPSETPRSDGSDDAIVFDTRRRGTRGQVTKPASRPTASPAPRAPLSGPGPLPGEPADDDYIEGRFGSRQPASRPGDDRVRPAPSRPTGGQLRRRRWTAGLLALALLWGVLTIGAVANAWGNVKKVPATASGDRPSGGSGRNVLMVGSDSRGSLSAEEIKKLGTGGRKTAEGARTDSIMVLHLPDGGGKPVLVSFPRDSYVPIPGHGSNKINAAYAIGGAPLLASTIEQTTGLRIDGYTEIGFGGFAKVVDAVGGVEMCLKRPMKDAKAHIDLKAGCQELDGATALGYVRARYSDPEGDLGRAKRQRQFLAALIKKVASPTNALLPWRTASLGGAMGDAIAVGEDDSMRDAASAMWGLKKVSGGGGYSVTVPVANSNYQTAAGSAVKWDSEKAKALFAQINADQPLSVTK
ncbi:MAG: LCP family protein [Micrococcales bacterium]|nr:LCP family protein [Micrococcales bacterium]